MEQRRPADEALLREMVLGGLSLSLALSDSLPRSLSRSVSLSARLKRGNLVAGDSTEHDRPTNTTAMVTGGSSVPKGKAVIMVRTSTGYFFTLNVS